MCERVCFLRTWLQGSMVRVTESSEMQRCIFQHLPQHFLLHSNTHTYKRVMVDSVTCCVRFMECTTWSESAINDRKRKRQTDALQLRRMES